VYLDYGIQASQSTAIFASDGLALGTFVLSFPRGPRAGRLEPGDHPPLSRIREVGGGEDAGARRSSQLNRALEDRVKRANATCSGISAAPTTYYYKSSPLGPEFLGITSRCCCPHLYRAHRPRRLHRVMETLRNMRRGTRRVRYENRVRAADGSWRTIARTLSPGPTGDRLYAGSCSKPSLKASRNWNSSRIRQGSPRAFH
jgi:hypothetical protein